MPPVPVLHRDDAFVLGYLTRAHGIRGEIRAYLEVQDLEPYLGLESVFLERADGTLAPVPVLSFRPVSDKEVLLRLGGVGSRNDAEALHGARLWLPETDLPDLPEDGFFYHEIIGYAVQDVTHGALGVVKDVVEMPGQDLLRVLHPTEVEVLIPIIEPIVGQVDRGARVLHTEVPEGLLDVYLNTAARTRKAG